MPNTDTRAAEDVGPYHAPHHAEHGHAGRRDVGPYHARTAPCRTHGRARRPRRAGAHGTPSGTPTRRHRERPRPRGPPRTSAPTTHRAMSAHTRRAPHTHTARRTRTPCAHLACAHLVGRDVLGAPRPRNAAEDAHGHAGRRDVGPYHAPHHAEHGHAGRRGRRPLPRTAPCRTHGRARRPRRAAPKGRHRGRPRRAAPTKTPPRQFLNHSFGGTRLSRPYPVGRDKRDPPYATSATLPTGRTGLYRLE